MSAYATYTAGTTTAGHKSHAEGFAEAINVGRENSSLYDKVNEDIKKGLSSELKIKDDSRVCVFTRPNSHNSYLRGKLTDEETIIVDKIAAGENSNSYFARISECTSDNLSDAICESFVGCWISLASSNLKYNSVSYYF